MATKKISAYEAQKAAEETARLAALKIVLDALDAEAARIQALRQSPEFIAEQNALALARHTAAVAAEAADPLAAARDAEAKRVADVSRAILARDPVSYDDAAHTEGHEGE